MYEYAGKPVLESNVICSAISVCFEGSDGGSAAPASETQGWLYVEEGT